MDRNFRIPDYNRAKIKRKNAVTVIFVFFYAFPCWQWIFTQLFELIGRPEYADGVSLIFLYGPVLLLLAISHKHIPADFFILLLCVTVYFCVTYIFHPEYEYVYTRVPYGVFAYVLRPDSGLYAYLFVRLVNEPEQLLKGLKISGIIIYAYSALRLYIAVNRGYWIEEGARGQELHLPYNLNFGYGLLIFVCCYFYCAFERGNIFYLVLACVGCAMILCGGSRGPFLDMLIFLSFYWSNRFLYSKKKAIFLLNVAVFFGVVMLLYRPVLNEIVTFFEFRNIPSRTLEMLVDGSVTESNGREELWLASFDMIKRQPFGYGAMGARHRLYTIHTVGHPHNFFIELLIEFGLVGGPFIIVLLLLLSLRQLLFKGRNAWNGVFLIFFAQCCQLLTSYTFWHSNGFWGVLAVGMCIYFSGKADGSGKKERKEILSL